MGAPKGHKKSGGRQAGTQNKKTRLRRIAEGKALGKMKNKILKRWDELIEAKMQLAVGVTVEKTTKMGTFIYQEPPDGKSLEYLLSIVVGKPTENHNITSDKEFPQIVFVEAKGKNGKAGNNGRTDHKGNVKRKGNGKSKKKST